MAQNFTDVKTDNVSNTPHPGSCACARCRANRPKRATLQNIQRSLESGIVTVRHNIVGSIRIDDAKSLGFGTNLVMVRFEQSHGWTAIDPITWEIA